MKGQVFIILLIFLVLIFFLIKNLSPAQLILQKYEIEEYEFNNLKEEILSTVLFSKGVSNISINLEEFLKFSKNSFASRGKTLRFFVVEVYYPKIISDVKSELNVSILNFLGHEIKILNITFSYNDSSSTFYEVKDGEKVRASFTFNISSSQSYELKIFYEEGSEKLEVFLEIGKSKFIAFFNVLLKNDFKMKDKFSISKEN